MVIILNLVQYETLLKNVTNLITKCDSNFITKCDNNLLQNMLHFLLQFSAVLLQNVTFITKCVDTSLFSKRVNINFELLMPVSRNPKVSPGNVMEHPDCKI